MSIMTSEAICRLAPVIPVITLERVEDAVPMAEALVAGGLPVLEVTLRTEAALDGIRAMAGVAGAVVGAGTVLSLEDVKASQQAGARFAVSPGATEALLAQDLLPLLPGVATASEVMRCLDAGIEMLKFFPAEANGGVAALKSLAGPLARARFCPTGGVSLANAPDYLALPNVICVGGSWVVPQSRVAQGDWDAIRRLAAEAAALSSR